MALMVSADHLRTAVVVETIIIFKRKRHAALPAVTQVHNQEGNNSYKWLNLAKRRVIRVHKLRKALFLVRQIVKCGQTEALSVQAKYLYSSC